MRRSCRCSSVPPLGPTATGLLRAGAGIGEPLGRDLPPIPRTIRRTACLDRPPIELLDRGHLERRHRCGAGAGQGALVGADVAAPPRRLSPARRSGARPRRISSTFPVGRFAICAGASTGTRRTVREATRPCRSVVRTRSSRSPVRVDQNCRSSRSRVPPNTITAEVLFRIVAAACSPHRASSCARTLERGQDRHPAPAHVRRPRLQRHRGHQRGLVQAPASGAGRAARRAAARPAGGPRGRCARSARTPAVRPGSPPRRAGTPSPAPRAAPRRRTTTRRRGSAAAAAAGLVSQPSAGMIVEVIEVRVRSLVLTNCMASCSNAGSAARRSSTGTSRCGPLRVGDPAEHVPHPLVARARRRAAARRARGGPGPPRTPDPPTRPSRGGGDHVRRPLGRDHRIGAPGQRVERDRRRRVRRGRRR